MSEQTGGLLGPALEYPWQGMVMAMGIWALLRDRAFWFLVATARRHTWIYLLSVLVQLTLTALILLGAQAIRWLFDLGPAISQTGVIRIIALITVLTVLGGIMSFINSWVQSYLKESVAYRLRREILDHLQRLPLSFHEGTHRSDFYTMMGNDLMLVRDFMVYDLQRFLCLPLTFAFIGTYLFSVHPTLGFLALAVTPIQLTSTLVLRRKYQEAVVFHRQETDAVFYTINETLQGIREVKANQLESRVDQRMREHEAPGILCEVQMTNLESIRGIVRDSPAQIGYIIGLGLGGSLMASGQIGPGGLVAFITLLGRLTEPFKSMVEIINNLQKVAAGARRLMDILNFPTEHQTTGLSLDPPIHSIRFSDLRFAYAPGREIIHGIDLEIPGGSSIAFVGPSGAGKSTLVKLLYRFYDPQSGQIEINGVPISQYSIESLRANMALISQDVFVFDGTIYQNIAAGRRDATAAQVRRAASLASALDFIEASPQGFETQIGERGIKLSQGQRQRVAIARAILRGASILVMDEPTSALDVETEDLVQSGQAVWASDCTVITIAHRLSTIKEADVVVFMEEGRIVETGSPGDLLSRRGRFYQYWQQQA